MTRVLIGGVGYRNLRDHSFGVALVDALSARSWPADVSVEDISYNPIALVQRLQDDVPALRFDLAIVAGALPRRGRPAGTLAAYRWDQELPPPDQVQDAIAEAVTGIIALDNTLVVGRHFAALPPTVVVVEVEPDAHEFGDELTPAVAQALARADQLVSEIALAPVMAGVLPAGCLPARRERHSGVVWAKLFHDERVH